MNLAVSTRMLLEAIVAVERAADDDELGTDLDTDLAAWLLVEELNGRLAGARRQLSQRLALALPSKRYVVEGVGQFQCKRRTDRRKWDTEDLLRAVLDTRRKVQDPLTGEVTYAEESPLEKVLAVWNLGVPRTTALRERGLSPDEFCEAEDAGYALSLQ